MRRRRLLRTATTAATATAPGVLLGGCLNDSLGPDGIVPGNDTTTATTDTCPNATRLSFQYESVEREDLVLRASADSLAVGGTLSVRLRNISSVEQITGNRNKVDVQRQTGTGWRSVFGRPSDQVWTDEAIPHEPGEGFDWRLSVEDSGFSFAEPLRPEYRTCEPVATGQYRFVFWGIVGRADDRSETTAGEETEAALTLRFRVTEG